MWITVALSIAFLSCINGRQFDNQPINIYRLKEKSMKKSVKGRNIEICKFMGLKRLVIIALIITVSAVVWAQTSFRITVIGDSTVCNYAASKYPMMGWGQVLGLFFENGTLVVNNKAIGGRSTRSFYQEGRWADIVKTLQRGEYVFIQFGHNDRDNSKPERYTDTTQYKVYLRLYVKESRAKGAIPVLVSPMNMNTWNGTSVREVFCEGANNYRGAMINVAKELDVPFIDLEKKSVEQQKRVGNTYNAEFIHLGLDAGEYPNYPDGSSDRLTHFQEMGANLMAKFVCDGIRELQSDADMAKLAAILKPLYNVNVSANKTNTGMITESGNSFPKGASITIKVKPSSSQKFQGWVDNSGKTVTTAKRYTFTMGDGDISFTAMFQGGTSMLSLNTSVVSGKGTVSPDNGSFATGAEVTLSATAAEGYLFDHWEGDLSGNDNPVTVTMDKEKNIKAYFIEDNKPRYTVRTEISGGGIISQSPQGTRLAEGSEVSFTAVGNGGWKFTEWSGDYSGTETKYTVSSMNKDINLTARFTPENPNLYEAEYAVVNSGVTETENTGFSGTGYVNVDNKIGSSIEIPLYVESEGEKTVTLTYANGSTSSRSFSISVNGTDVISSQAFESTGAWTTWLQKNIPLTLQKGINTVILTSNDADGGPNMDKIEIAGQASAVAAKTIASETSMHYKRGNLEISYIRPGSFTKIELFNLSGQKVMARNLNGLTGCKSSIPLNKLKSGNYIVKMTVDNCIKKQRVVFFQ